MVTRNDVAKRAGVSVAVVSYVINNKPNVKESTRQKILQAIEELGYKPNLTARSLKTKKTNQIGILVNRLGDPFEAGMLLGVEEKAREHNQLLFIQTYHKDEEERLKTIFMGRVDGVILMGQHLKPATIDYFTKTGVPLYSITQPVKAHKSLAYVDIDWDDAMVKLIEHLKQLGHKNIGFMANAEKNSYHHTRYLSFLKAMKASGLHFRDNMLLHGGGTLVIAYDAMMHTLKNHPQGTPLPFTAIICANDLMAVGALSACRDFGMSIPGQLSIAACEDILMASHTFPALTSIHFPRPKIGPLALEAILEKINGGNPDSITVAGELKIRQSTHFCPQNFLKNR